MKHCYQNNSGISCNWQCAVYIHGVCLVNMVRTSTAAVAIVSLVVSVCVCVCVYVCVCLSVCLSVCLFVCVFMCVG